MKRKRTILTICRWKSILHGRKKKLNLHLTLDHLMLDKERLVIHGKGKVILDDFEAMGNDLCSKDGLISTTSDGDPAVGGSSLLSVSKNSYCGSSSSNLH
ncbi:hypothetical protein Tco_0850301 [Tanacetum coccineum]